MCGRFYVDDETLKEIEKIAGRIDSKMGRTGDIHPSEPALVLQSSGKEIIADALAWGYEVPGRKSVIFNARSETVSQKPLFARDFKARRCIIPAGHYYEWKQPVPGTKEKYIFHIPGETLYLAGIYHKYPQGDRFTILTREAGGCALKVHGRMPVLLTRRELDRWLLSPAEAEALLRHPFTALGRIHADKSSSVRNGGSEDNGGYEQLSLFRV